MPTNTAATDARQFHTQQVHYLRKSIAYTDDGTEVTVGKIPSGALILAPASGVHIVTAFNAGTSNVLDIGADTGNDDPDDYATDLALGTAGFVAVDEGATGVFLATADTTVTCTVALSGTAATAGAAEVVIAYIPDNDG